MAGPALFAAIAFALLVTRPAAGAEELRLAQLPSSEPPVPDAAEAFVDEFEGDGLGEHWRVLNADPDSYIVEGGALTIIAKAVGGLTNADIPNIFRIDRPLPDGDWEVTLTFSAALQTGRDQIQLGLYDDAGNMIVSEFRGDSSPCCGQDGFSARTSKWAGGEQTYFTEPVLLGGYSAIAETIGSEIVLKLIKSGRAYRTAARVAGEIDDAGGPRWRETNLVSSLRPPERLVLNASQWEATDGENLYAIESIRIEPVGRE